MKIGHTTATRMLLLGALYFAQGVPWGFVTVTVVLSLTNLGFDAAALGGMLSTAYLPWIGKPLLGPLIDAANFGRWGRRRPIIVAAQVGMAASVLALATVDPRGSWSLFLALIFLHNAMGAFQDVATDALALVILPERERGTGNGVMSAAKFVGVWAGGPALSGLAAHGGGWTTLAPLVAAMLLFPTVLLLFVDEAHPPPDGRVARGLRPLLGSLRLVLATRATWFAVGLALTITASEGLLQPMFIPLLRRTLAFSETDVSLLLSIATAVSAAASLLGGVLSDSLGRTRTLILGVVGLAACNGLFALLRPLWPSFPFVLGFTAVSAAFSGVVYSAVLALFMDLCRPETGATQFQLYMALLNLRNAWSSFAGGRLAVRLDPAPLFGLAVLVDLIAVVFIALLARRNNAAR